MHLYETAARNDRKSTEAQPNRRTHSFFFKAAIPGSSALPNLKSSTSCTWAHTSLWFSCIYNSQEIFTWETKHDSNVPKCHSKPPVIKILPLWPSCWLKNFHSTSVIHSAPCVGLKQQFPAPMTENFNMQGTKNPHCCHPAEGKLTCKSIGRDAEAVLRAPCTPPSLTAPGQGDRA